MMRFGLVSKGGSLSTARSTQTKIRPRHALRSACAAIEALEERRLFAAVNLISTAMGGGPATGGAGFVGNTGVETPSVSDDGRFIAFVSESGDLVAGDSNGVGDVFVRDTQTGTISLVSVAQGGGSGNAVSGESQGFNNTFAISGNGRYVVFISDASNLVANDNNGKSDLFVRDLQAGTTQLVTVNAAGTGSGNDDVGIDPPVISDDGRFVAFTSKASDLVSTPDNDNGQPDVFVRDLQSGTTTELSLPAAGNTGGGVGKSPSISGDGQNVAFVTNDAILPGIGGGQQVLHDQVYVYNTTLGPASTQIVSQGPNASTAGDQDSEFPRISADGRHVAFLSNATNLMPGFTDANGADDRNFDVFLRDLDAGTTVLVSHAPDSTTTGGDHGTFEAPSISANGRYVAYRSDATNLVAGLSDTNSGEDLFQFDAATGSNKGVSVNPGGTATGSTPSNDVDTDENEGPAMSDDGRYIVFSSTAQDLVANDATIPPELFIRDTLAGSTTRLFGDLTGTNGAPLIASGAQNAAISANGVNIVFIASPVGIYPNTQVTQPQIFSTGAAGGGGNNGGGGGGTGTTDLVPTLSGTLPPAAIAGGKVKARPVVTIANAGPDAFAGPVTVTLFVSTDQALDNADLVASRSITRKVKLKAGQAKTLRIPLNSLPDVPDGSYFLLAQLDPGQTGDTNSDNNVTAFAQPIVLAAPFVDLTGVFAGSPTGFSAGKKTAVAINVTNAGNIAAAGATSVVVTATPVAGGAPVTLATVPAKLKLKPGKSKTLKLKVVPPADLVAGSYTLGGTINASNQIAESDVTNNTLTGGGAVTVA
jgi:Tol biopolymer transport system component